MRDALLRGSPWARWSGRGGARRGGAERGDAGRGGADERAGIQELLATDNKESPGSLRCSCFTHRQGERAAVPRAVQGRLYMCA